MGTMMDACWQMSVTRQPEVKKKLRKGRWNLLPLHSLVGLIEKEEMLVVDGKKIIGASTSVMLDEKTDDDEGCAANRCDATTSCRM